jgi:serine/threonine protein kinase/tetratricopeptide (TPR) repeat protein
LDDTVDLPAPPSEFAPSPSGTLRPVSPDANDSTADDALQFTDSMRRAAFERIQDVIPDYIDNYKIMRKLGSGGMGIVFLAREPGLRRDVALKVLRADAPPDSELKFLREAQITSQLAHPGIMPVYHLGRDRNTGLSYYTMKFATGKTLSETMRDKTGRENELRRLLRVYIDVCHAVAFAHSKNVIHRDLKPGNIWLGMYGEVMILDWGLAMVLERRRRKTAVLPSGVEVDRRQTALIDISGGGAPADAGRPKFVGTPAYMSPEQARGDIGVLTIHSDIYSLGAMLYEILTGHPPVEGETLNELLEAVRRNEIIPPHRREPTRFISPELSAICLRALSSKPDDRFHSARQLAALVEAFLEGVPQWGLEIADGFNRMEVGRHWAPIRVSEWTVIDRGLVSKAKGENAIIYLNPLMGDVAIECEAVSLTGAELSFIMNSNLPTGPSDAPRTSREKFNGYILQFGADANVCSKIARNDVDVMIDERARVEIGRRYNIRAERTGSTVRLRVDGHTVLNYSDAQPLTGRYFGLYSYGPGARFEWVRIFHKGSPLNVSALTIPDAFFARGLWNEALDEYRHVAASHPHRRIGWLARYRAGLCLIKTGRPADCDIEFKHLKNTPMEMYILLGFSQRSRALNQLNLAALYLHSIFKEYPKHPGLGDADAELWDLALDATRTAPDAARQAYSIALNYSRGDEPMRLRGGLWLANHYEIAGKKLEALIVFGRLLEMPGGFERAIIEMRAAARNRGRLSVEQMAALLSAIPRNGLPMEDSPIEIAFSTASARLMRTLLCLEMGKFGDALDELTNAKTLPDGARTDCQRAVETALTLDALRKLGRIDDALAAARASETDYLFTLWPQLFRYYRAKCERAAGNYKQAIELIDSVQSSHRITAYRLSSQLLKATCLYSIGETDLAHEALQSALPTSAIDSQPHRRAHIYLGIWFSSPDGADAKQHFRAARGHGKPQGASDSGVSFKTAGLEKIEPAFAYLADHFINRKPSAKLVDWLRGNAPAMIADELCFLAGEFYRRLSSDKIAEKFYKLAIEAGPANDWHARRSAEMLATLNGTSGSESQ